MAKDKDKTADELPAPPIMPAAPSTPPMTAAEQEGVVPTAPVKKPYVSPWPGGKVRGWEVSHPSYGSLRVWESEVETEAAAVESFRKETCPNLTTDMLKETGLITKQCWFTPAASEIGHPLTTRLKK